MDFPSLKNEDAFRRQLSRQYSAFEDALDAKLDQPSKTRQLWHTPTELFAPHYGDAIARYLLANYKLTLYPYHDLIIHEVGAGNGTLMRNILDYIKDTDPEAYARTRYRIIEISSRMSARQQQHLASEHAAHIQLINKSIFDWDTYVPEPNYFLALEVADNFPHDLVRYAPGSSGDPLQAIVLIDGAGDFFEFYTPQLDPLAASFLRLRTATAERHARRHPRAGPLFPDARSPPLLTRFSRALSPFAPQLSDAEYLPTHLHRFFAILHHAFPSHRLLLGDFSSLPNAVPGINAPVVQTRFERRVVPVRTPFVHQGFFDILFPTNFELAEAMYRARTGKLTRVLPQSEFLERWARVGDARTGDGECPMLSWYQNAKVLMTV